MARALTLFAQAALGPVGGAQLLALQSGPLQNLPGSGVPDDPAVDQIIDAALGSGPVGPGRAGALTDLGALLQVARANSTTGADALSRLPAGFDADGVTVTVLGRAAEGGSCPARLDYLLELSADPFVARATLDTELSATEKSCQGDPTVALLFGADALTPPAEQSLFEGLQRSRPGSPVGWLGEGEIVLSKADGLLSERQPFAAEAQYRLAALLLARAQALQPRPDRGASLAEARAWTAAGYPGRAVPVEEQVMATAPGQDAGLQLAGDLERTHRFAAAGTALKRLPAVSSDPPAPSASLYPSPDRGSTPLGLGRAVGLTVQSPPPVVGAAEAVSAEVLIPPSREEVDPFTGNSLEQWVDLSSVSEDEARDLLLAGDARSAAASASPLLASIGRLAAGSPDPSLAELVDACSGGVVSTALWCEQTSDQASLVGVGGAGLSDGTSGSPPSAADLADRIAFDLENLWRWSGRYDLASRVTSAWERQEPGDFLAADQCGEVAYLQGKSGAASRWFSEAARLAPTAPASQTELLKLGQSQAQAGSLGAALGTDDRVGAQAVGANPVAVPQLRYLAAFEAAGVLLQEHDYSGAIRAYEQARGLLTSMPGDVGSVAVPTALDTDEGLADVQDGRPGTGMPRLLAALATDSGDPVFLQNVAYAERRLGHTTLALAYYRRAVSSDPTNYPAANDLGVLLADQGQLASAASVLRESVGAGTGYALARFNLGVVLSRMGPGHALEADGDLGEAIRMDPSLAGAAPLPRFDDGTILTTLDLSRPPPPGWHFTEAETFSPSIASGVALVALLVALGIELMKEKGSDSIEEKFLDEAAHGRGRRRKWSTWRPGPALAVVATAAALTWPLAASDGATWTEDAVLALAVALMVLAYARVHLIVSRPAEVPLRHHTWAPPLVVAAGAAVAHLAFAPLPVARPEEELHRHRRWMAPLLIGVVGVTLLVIFKITGEPSARAFGTAALVMTGSALVRVEPCDGAYVRGRVPVILASCGLIVVSTLVLLNVL